SARLAWTWHGSGSPVLTISQTGRGGLRPGSVAAPDARPTMAARLSRRVIVLSRQLAKRVAPPPLRLTFSSDAEPGIRRRRRGPGCTYLGPDGSRVRDGDVLARIRKLAIPPAGTQVWICAHPGGHLQATGGDARGRKQYRYHATWTEQRGAQK